MSKPKATSLASEAAPEAPPKIAGSAVDPASAILARSGNSRARRIFLLAVLAAGLLILAPRLEELRQAVRLIPQAAPVPLILALVCQAVVLVAQTWATHYMLLNAGPGSNLKQLMQVQLASGLASLLVPSSGISGLAVRVRYFREMGYSLDTAALTLSTESLGQGIAHCLMLGAVLLYQTWRGETPAWKPVLLVFGVVSLAGLLLGVLVSRTGKHDWRMELLAPLNRLRGALGRGPLTTNQLRARINAMRRTLRFRERWGPALWLTVNIVRVAATLITLDLALRAVGQSVPLPILAVGFSLSDVLGSLSTMPNGLVVTETALSAMLLEAGVAPSAAMAGVVLFRLASLWIPRTLGAPAWYNIQRHSSYKLW